MSQYMSGQIQLDKDYMIHDNKRYAPEVCCFIERSKNGEKQPSKQRDFIAVSPNGDTYTYWSQQICALEHNLTARSIGKVLNGQLHKHKEWKFYYKEQ